MGRGFPGFNTQQPNVLCEHTLASLSNYLRRTFQSCFGLTTYTIEATVAHLPSLTGLHISTCEGFDFVDVFRVIPRIPSLSTLSFSVWVGILVHRQSSDELTEASTELISASREHPTILSPKPQGARRRPTRNTEPFPTEKFPFDFHPFRGSAPHITHNLRSVSDNTFTPPRVLRTHNQPTRGNLASCGPSQGTHTRPSPPFDLRGMQAARNPRRPGSVCRRSGK